MDAIYNTHGHPDWNSNTDCNGNRNSICIRNTDGNGVQYGNTHNDDDWNPDTYTDGYSNIYNDRNGD